MVARHLANTPPKKRVSGLRRFISVTALVGLCFGAGIGIASAVVWLTGGLPGMGSDEVLGIVVSTTSTSTTEPSTTTSSSVPVTVPVETTTTSTTTTSSTTTTVPETTTTTVVTTTTTTRRNTTTTTFPTTTTTIPTTTTTVDPGPDVTGPIINMTWPSTDGQVISPLAPGNITFSCSDPGSNASGVASCQATLDGQPIPNGFPIPGLPTLGWKTVRVVAVDHAGNETILIRTYRVGLLGFTQVAR